MAMFQLLVSFSSQSVSGQGRASVVVSNGWFRWPHFPTMHGPRGNMANWRRHIEASIHVQQLLLPAALAARLHGCTAQQANASCHLIARRRAEATGERASGLERSQIQALIKEFLDRCSLLQNRNLLVSMVLVHHHQLIELASHGVTTESSNKVSGSYPITITVGLLWATIGFV